MDYGKGSTDGSFKRLAKRWMPQIWTAANRFKVPGQPGCDEEDIVNLCLYELHRALEKIPSGEGPDFDALAKSMIWHRAQDPGRKAECLKRDMWSTLRFSEMRESVGMERCLRSDEHYGSFDLSPDSLLQIDSGSDDPEKVSEAKDIESVLRSRLRREDLSVLNELTGPSERTILLYRTHCARPGSRAKQDGSLTVPLHVIAVSVGVTLRKARSSLKRIRQVAIDVLGPDGPHDLAVCA